MSDIRSNCMFLNEGAIKDTVKQNIMELKVCLKEKYMHVKTVGDKSYFYDTKKGTGIYVLDFKTGKVTKDNSEETKDLLRNILDLCGYKV